MRKFRSMLSATVLFMLAMCAGSNASAAAVADRITQPIENAAMAPIKGTVHPMAKPEYEQGLTDNAKVLGLRLVFKRSDAQESSLKALLQAQLNPASMSYHQWLSPAQFGQQFGMTSADLAKASAWLQAEGFTITSVSQSSNSIGFSGSVASVEKSFQTEIHTYVVNGETHFANSTNISVPAALAGAVAGVRGLDDFRLKPKVRFARNNPLNARPQFTSGISGTHYVQPGDMATIYDINPLYSAGNTGKGVTIAIMGQTDIVAADITSFRAAAGLPVNNPVVVTVPGTTPLSATAGAASGDLSETDLDLEYSGGIATGANVILVNSDNVFDSLEYAVEDTISSITVPIISLSYGECEAGYTTANLTQVEGFLEQANAQGQTVLLAAGDTGAADCDDSGTTVITSAVNGLAVDYPGSSVYVTDVGGSEFMGDGTAAAPQTGSGTYWTANGTGGASDDVIASAKSYIPEMAWNDTTFSIASGGGLSGTGGGVSSFWKKPSWQAGVPNIPADGFRDVPDVALPASPDHDGLLYCTQVQTTGSGTAYVSSCASGFRISDPGQSDDQGITAAGGTSFAAPSFAGLLAIAEQKLGAGGSGGGLGNINPSLYTLASNATTYASAFHDITTGNNQVPCTAGSPNCGTTGLTNVIGYTAGTGYDQTTGLGSVDANNFVTAYAALVAATGTTTSVVTTPSTTLTTGEAVTFTATVAPNTLTTAPAGTVTFTVDGAAQTPVALSTAAPYTAVLTEANGLTTGTHAISATFTSSDSTYTGSTSQTVNVSVTAGGTAATTVAVTADPTTLPLGSSITLTATITGTTAGTLTGPLVFSTNGVTIGTVNQVAIGTGATATATLSVPAANASLGFAAGTDTITATYKGDGFNAPSTGTTTVTVTNPGITLAATNVTISSPSPGNSGTSTITLTSTGSYTGTATLTATGTLNVSAGFGSSGASTASVALSPGVPGTSTLTLTTVAATGNLQKGPAANLRKIGVAGGLAAGCVLLLLLPGIRRKRWPAALVMLVFLSVGAGLGCGGGTAGGAPKGTYTVTVTATDSSNPNITGSTNFTVTIQ